MQKREIYLALVQYRKANYSRPCVVIESFNGIHTVGLVSSAMDLYNPVFDFLIPANHPDFVHTGLSKTSYVIGSSFQKITDKDIVEKWGILTGELAKQFDDWIG